MVDGEKWRVVPSIPQWMASSMGRIMLIPYSSEMPNGGTRQYGGEASWGVWSKADARFIVSYKGHTYKIAQMVCEAFHGTKPFEGAVTMHLDENATNNRANNLAWGTQKENLNAPGFIEYCKGRTGANNPRVKAKKRISV